MAKDHGKLLDEIFESALQTWQSGASWAGRGLRMLSRDDSWNKRGELTPFFSGRSEFLMSHKMAEIGLRKE